MIYLNQKEVNEMDTVLVNFKAPKEVYEKYKKICKERGFVLQFHLNKALLDFIKEPSVKK